jgi:CRISPR/Cas system Type II protein with McrA/HNH and RuvC-like nuclease domain
MDQTSNLLSSKIKEKILELRSMGYSYNKIREELNCSKGVISYHCGVGQKQKTLIRKKKCDPISLRISRKIENFSTNKTYNEDRKSSINIQKKIQLKIQTFSREFKMGSRVYVKPSFTAEELLNKIGKTPKCYLSGQPIVLEDTKSWQLDHIVPRTRGGSNDLNNANICLAKVNSAKGNMTNEEFLAMCQQIIDYQKITPN